MKTHYADIKIKARKRINIIIGQLNGLHNMIDNDECCVKLLNQSLAIQNSLRSLDAVLFEKHLSTQVTRRNKFNEPKVITELIDIFNRVNR